MSGTSRVVGGVLPVAGALALWAATGACAEATVPPHAATGSPPMASAAAAPHDGAHDFDWELGEWTTELRRLEKPLTGSTSWVEYHGTSTVRPILGGRANLLELVVESAAGRIEAASLRLYDPAARQWSLHFFNIADGQLTVPMVGEFADGRGVFFAQDTFRGRAILVRFVASRVDDRTWRFEQSFSADGGAHWEPNWIATDRRR